MKMKKTMMARAALAVGLPLLVLAGCAKTGTDAPVPAETDGAPIAFSTYLSRPVVAKADPARGSIGSKDVLQQNYSFGVFASYTKETAFNSSSDTPDFMHNVEVEYKDNKWTYAPLRYWPKSSSDMVTFSAYAPYVASDGTNSYGISNISAQDVVPTFTFTLADAADVDLLYAQALNRTPTSDAVMFQFGHKLAKLNLKVKTSDEYEDTEVTLTNFAIESGLPKSATFGLNDGNFSAPSSDSYTGIAQTSRLTVTNTPQTLGAEAGYMVIPPSGEFELKGKVSYTYQTAGSVALTVNDDEFTSKITLVEGKVYTLTLSIKLNAIEFDVESVTQWSDADTDGWPKEVTLPQNS